MIQTAQPESSTAIGGHTNFVEVECHLRAAGRLLEHAGVTDTESARLARVVFRIASRVRSDRLAVAA